MGRSSSSPPERRLFEDGGRFGELDLRQARTLDNGVVITTYNPKGR